MAREFGDRTGDYRPNDRWRGEDRERSSWRSGDQGTSEREDERGFFQRAGDEVRSWFNDDNERRYLREHERRTGEPERERGYGRMGQGAADYRREDRDFGQGGFGGMAPRSGWERERESGYEPSRTGGRWAESGYRADRFGEERGRFGGTGASRSDREWNRRGHPQSWGEANRGQRDWDRDRELGEMPTGYAGISDTLGGFGNQRFGSDQDDHYRSWRNRQMQQLDSDYADYCREREQQFHQDFDSWRQQRQGRPTTSSTSPDLGTSPNAGVGTTTSSVTGTAGQGSAAASGSISGSPGGSSVQTDTSGSTEMAGTGSETGTTGTSGRTRKGS